MECSILGDISLVTITNCWRHAWLSNQPQSAVLSQEPSPATEVTNLLSQLIQQQPIQAVVSTENFLNPDEEEVADMPQGSLEEHVAAQFGSQS